MKYPTRRPYKHAKNRYWVRNWFCYERGLRQRSDVTLWFSHDAIERVAAAADGTARRPTCVRTQRSRCDPLQPGIRISELMDSCVKFLGR